MCCSSALVPTCLQSAKVFILGAVFLLSAIPMSAQQAQFVKLDTTTQGTWHSIYGADGYNTIADAIAYPSYATVNPTGQSEFVWSSVTSDVRALQRSNSTNRIAAILYSSSTFSIDLNLTDGLSHQVAFYCLDWDLQGRKQAVSILNAQTGALLDSRGVTAFSNGQYLVWNLSGHVRVQFTNLGPANAGFSGIFFDPASSNTGQATATAQFLQTDTGTQGNWRSNYGSDGFTTIGDAIAYPAYATITPSGQTLLTWATSTTDVRALQKSATNDRIAAAWDSATNFAVDINLTDGHTHEVSFYCLDWDNSGRAETVTIHDAQTGTILDSRGVTSFNNGRYLVWNLSGHVAVTVADTFGTNAVVSGLFFGGPAPAIASLFPAWGLAGTSVTITGNNFGSQTGKVKFNGLTAATTGWSSTSIVTSVPAGATTGNVQVTVGAVNSSGVVFTVTASGPTITSLSPLSSSNNSPVTISGSGFGNAAPSSTVTFACASCAGTVGAHVTSWTPNAIIVPVPNLATTGPVTVTVNSVPSNGVAFTVPNAGTLAGAITQAITGSPVGGALVTALQSGVTVASTTSGLNGAYSFAALAPGTYDLQVSATGYATAFKAGISVVVDPVNPSSPVNFMLGTVPVETSLSPNWGLSGTDITITGSNFGVGQASTVTFNGALATPITWSNKSITVPVPASATSGPVVVTVGGVGSNALTFSVGTGVLSGTVTSAANGTPVSGALVQVMQSNVVQASKTTAANGTYTISGLAPGIYNVLVSATGFANLASGAITLAVGTTTFNGALQAPGTDSGTVKKGAAAVVGATVTALQNGVALSSATTDSSGSFSIANLSAGTYVMQASASGYDTKGTSATVTAGKTTTTNFSLTTQLAITYEYDALGRLAAVVSPTAAAAYHYDSVGNVTSITRPTVTKVNILSFTPISGSAGTTVTISGTGFSTTASQNTVTFSSTGAIVNTATSTQLTVTVPPGATTGKIAVTAPAGSGTSSSSFAVTSAGNAPTITSVSPPVVALGNSFTIAGTNFDPNPVNDSVIINGLSQAIVTAATSTALTVTVPIGATTGKVVLTTPTGTSVSSGYLFIAPAGATASQVTNTYRLTTLPSTQTVQVGTGNQISLLSFDAIAGQTIAILPANSTFANPCGFSQYLESPTGSVIASGTWMCGGYHLVGPLIVSTTGTYTVQLGPNPTAAGQVDLAVNSVPPDVTATIYPSAAGTTIGPLTLTSPGQKFVLTFNGVAGRRISLVTYSTTWGCGNLQGFILNPDGSTLLTDTCLGGTSGAGFTHAVVLPQTGTYTLQMNAAYTTGSVTVTLWDVPPDQTATIPGTVQIVTPGQLGRFTFTGSYLQNINLQFTSTGAPNCSWEAWIYNPDGSQVPGFFQGCYQNGQTSGPIVITTGPITLQQTGVYSVVMKPDGGQPTITGTFSAQ